jgi:salicylate hydroxylase
VEPGSAIVAGAGVGGLAAALALARRGWSVTLVERRTGFSEVGAGIQISPNASRILIDLGLGPALRRAASEPPRVVVRALRSGRRIGEVALAPFMRERFGAPYYVIHRADLQTLLLDAVRGQPNVTFLLGRAVTGASEEPGQAQVAIEKAGGVWETLAADLVVGADGLWSKLRAALGDARAPQYQGFAAWRATMPRAEAPAEFSAEETGLWLGRSGHVVHYPVAGGRLLNIVAVERRAEPVEGWATPGARDELLKSLGDAARPLRDLLGAPREWLLWSLFDLPATRMAKGRLALLGDAAHPVLPFLAQGGALAIEDAAVLGQALAQAPDVPAALARYARARLSRARRVQAAARRNGRAYHAGGVPAFIRDRIMAGLGPEGMAGRYAWLYGWRGK